MNNINIVFGQQPNGFFPKRFFISKIESAKKLQKEIGGKIIWFCHDSDSDYRETVTILKDKQSGKEARLNFTQENKIQKKYSPLYAKKIPKGWQEETLKVLPQYVDANAVELFRSVKSDTAAGFCIRMYQKMGLLDGIEIIRSSDPSVRRNAIEVADFFIDTEYENEIVRARYKNDHLELHAGGDKFINLPLPPFNKETISPARDSRFIWMQSIVNATHYILGASEKEYLGIENFSNVDFIERSEISEPELSLTTTTL